MCRTLSRNEASCQLGNAQTAIVRQNIQKVGVSGQVKKTLFLTFVFSLSCCAASDRELTFAGHLVPRSGTCDPASTAVLTLLHQSVVFAPNSGTLILRGSLSPDGHLAAELTLPGIDHKPYRLVLDAAREGDAVRGSYTTPRCRYDVSLERTDN